MRGKTDDSLDVQINAPIYLRIAHNKSLLPTHVDYTPESLHHLDIA